MATSSFYDSDGNEIAFNLPPDYESSGHAKVVTADDVVTLTPTLDTSAYAADDTLFDTTAVVLGRVASRPVTLQSVAVTDKDDQKGTIDLFFFDSAPTTFGTANAAPTISDADALKYLGHVRISAADYLDVGGVSVACVRGIGLVLESATTSVYVAAVIREAKTYTASGLQFRFGVYQS